MKNVKAMLKELTLEDLRSWAGTRIFDRGRGYVGRVSDLSLMDSGKLAAWVSGSEQYATSVRYIGNGMYDYFCSCPYDYGPCKHVVAVLLAAAERIKRKKDIPELSRDDDLYLELNGHDVDDEIVVPGGEALKAQLSGKRKKELLQLILDLADEIPEVSRRLQERLDLESGCVDKIITSLRREIRQLTSEDVWYNSWSDEGNQPDYSHVEQQLEALLSMGYGDAVLTLGEELWQGGRRQVEEADDEGEVASSIGDCLDIVMQALPETSKKPAEQLLWIIQRALEDEYGLLDGSQEYLDDSRYTQVDWQDVAAVLESRLGKESISNTASFSERYHRERLVDWLRQSYRRGGLGHKIIPLLEVEAERCHNYDILVETLVAGGRKVEARSWCVRGFNNTIDSLPGVAAGLQKRLRKMAEEEARFDLVAAYRAEDYFSNPCEGTYTRLQGAAEKAGVWPDVRDVALQYLQTGERPVKGRESGGQWPLQEAEIKERSPKQRRAIRSSFPDYDLMVEIALLEKRNDDAVTIYQSMDRSRRWDWGLDKTVADAVSESHPEISLNIWLKISKALIAEVKVNAYLKASEYLRKMQKMYERTGRIDEWTALLSTLRAEHRAKRRLMEVLRDLENNRSLLA